MTMFLETANCNAADSMSPAASRFPVAQYGRNGAPILRYGAPTVWHQPRGRDRAALRTRLEVLAEQYPNYG